MILRFRNLGVIANAEIDISKPLIVFTGPNGTGKTYLSYVINELPRSLGGFLLGLIRRKEGKELYNIYNPALFVTEDIVKGTLDPEELYKLFQNGIREISKSMISQLNLSNKLKEAFTIEVVSSLSEWKDELFNLKLDCGFFLKIHKESGTYDYTVKAIPEYKDRTDAKKDANFALALFLNSLFFTGASNSMMFTAERSGIALFSTEIAVGRLRSETDPPRYPRAIVDGLAESADKANYSKYVGSFVDLADDIEKKVLHGKVRITKDGNLRFAKEGKEFEIAVASSTAKALADIVFYIHHRAELMSRLLIDEPEIHLHPDNQIILAKIFGRMVNRGLHLLVSTHSDYIIREFNNMIMAEVLLNKDVNFNVKKYGYEKEELLKSSDVIAYYFNINSDGKVIVEKLDVNKYGFDVKSINDVIETQNSITNDLYDRLTYEETDDGDE